MKTSVNLKLLGGALALLPAAGACAGHAYLPSAPGGGDSDLSGQNVREAWVADHPEASEEIREAILQGVFVEGMSLEHRDVVTNPKRKGTTGNGFWRSYVTGDQVRYRWFVAAEREPFDDGLGRPVCELVYVHGILRTVRYCSGTPVSGNP